jgi:hypothetical protein
MTRPKFCQASDVGCKSAGHQCFSSMHIFAAARAFSNSAQISLDALVVSTASSRRSSSANDCLGIREILRARPASFTRLRTLAMIDAIIAASVRTPGHCPHPRPVPLVDSACLPILGLTLRPRKLSRPKRQDSKRTRAHLTPIYAVTVNGFRSAVKVEASPGTRDHPAPAANLARRARPAVARC